MAPFICPPGALQSVLVAAFEGSSHKYSPANECSGACQAENGPNPAKKKDSTLYQDAIQSFLDFSHIKGTNITTEPPSKAHKIILDWAIESNYF
jgi:hypothetical protein